MATERPQHRLKSGAPAHKLTAEDRRKGGLRRGEVLREQAKPFRVRLAEKLDERADELAETLIAAGREDWRALVAGLDQAFGKPTERHELSGQLEVDSPDVVAAVDRFAALTAAAVRSAARTGEKPAS